MSNCPFCNLDSEPELDPAELAALLSTPVDGARPIDFFRRVWRGIQWLFPATLLVLMPKCPLCVVAYVALFTGIGITVSTARWIQILMLLFCVISLAYLAIRRWHLRSWTKLWPKLLLRHKFS